MDASRLTQKDPFEAILYNDLRSGFRGLLAVIRVCDFCDCGCKGNCTIWYLMWVIAWDLKNAANGVFAMRRHCGVEFVD
mgnify:CR=1 FL=1